MIKLFILSWIIFALPLGTTAAYYAHRRFKLYLEKKTFELQQAKDDYYNKQLGS